VSLLAHEFSHSMVSRYYGIPVPRITLFLFGGMAQMSSEPDRPKQEFWIAIAGPLMSIFISLVCTNLALWNADETFLSELAAEAPEAMSRLGPVQTTLFWLGSVNMLLAVFNMIPGFPMDGGRVFRAAVWAISGDRIKATRWASNGGRYFGWSLMAFGVLGLFGDAGIGALWWILIGWFISSLAAMSYRQLVIDDKLKDFTVADLMHTKFDVVAEEKSLTDFVEQQLLHSSQQFWPVMKGSSPVGVVTLLEIARLPEESRRGKSVGDVMRPLDSVTALTPDARMLSALEALTRASEEPALVLEKEQLVGLIRHADVMQWMLLHGGIQVK
jgi:Zn-dependent protease/predicted transcriptional regulator